MKFSPSIFAVPATLLAVLLLANCSSDPAPAPPASAGSTSATAGSAGKAGVAGSGGSAGGGASAGGASAGGPSAGGSSAGAGTAGAGTAGGAAVDATYATVRSLLGGTKCNGGNGCHGQEGNPLPMANDDKLYGTLMSHTTKNCGKTINVASPADSALIKLMLGDCGTAPNVTPRMPREQCWDGDKPEENEYCVPTATVAAVQAWIAKGAPQQ